MSWAFVLVVSVGALGIVFVCALARLIEGPNGPRT